MARTVDEYRNAIRVAVDRHERLESTAFTKEALAAVADALDADVAADGRPSKTETRAAILRAVGRDPERADRPLRKGDLEAVADALDAEF